MTQGANPPGSPPNQPPASPAGGLNLLQQLKQIAAQDAPALVGLKAVEAGLDKIDNAGGRASFKLIQTTDSLRKLAIQLKQSLGDEADTTFNNAVENFKKLNDSASRFNVNLEKQVEVQEFYKKSFLFTDEYGNDINKASLRTARLVNLFPKGREAIETFALQTGQSLPQATQELIRLGRAGQRARLGLGALVGTQKELIDTGIAFGFEQDKLRNITLEAEVLGRSLGKSGKDIIGILGGLRNVQQRVDFTSKLAQIAGMTPGGAGIPVELLESADPEKAIAGIRKTLAIFRRQFQKMGDLERNKFAQAITSVFGTQNRALVQTALQTSPNEAQIRQLIGRGRAALGAAAPRQFTPEEVRAFTTEREALQQQIRALQVRVAQRAAQAVGRPTGRMTETQKNTEALNEKFGDLSGAVGTAVKKLGELIANIEALNGSLPALGNNFNNLLNRGFGANFGSILPQGRTTP